MANQEITKTKDKPDVRSVDVFDAMRDEMNGLFDRCDCGWPGLPRCT